MRIISEIISDLIAPTTVKEYIKKYHLSITLTKKIKYGGILLNGQPVTVRAVAKNGDEIKLCFPTATNDTIVPMNIPITTLFEDDYVLAVVKPAGMPTHPSRGNNLPTLANAIIGKYGVDFTFRSINRLDRDTAGIVLIAKDQMSAGKLSEAMKNRKFTKLYNCTVHGTPPARGLINEPIRRESPDSIKRIVATDGKTAITEYFVLEQLCDRAKCSVKIYTGRTHQIRVHMAHIGHPLIGDFLYGNRDSGIFDLKCVGLSFPHPESGEMIEIKI